MRLDLVVGSNGAGKTTFIQKVLLPVLPPGTVFVNADEIARQRWPGASETHAYEAAKVAARTRAALIEARRPFVAETVFSHPSKLDLIQQAQGVGFTVALHVVMVPEDLTVARVEHRVAAGGHSVPEEKIHERFHRLWPLALQAAAISDLTTFYDNSGIEGPRIVAHLIHGIAVGELRWPAWTPTALSSNWAPVA